MASIITIFGNLSSEPRLKTKKDNFTQVLRFSIVSESSNKKLTYFEVLSYDTSLVNQLKKGSLVQLTGEFELADSQTDEEGRLYTSLRVVADRIFILKSDSSNEVAVDEENGSDQNNISSASYTSFTTDAEKTEAKPETSSSVNSFPKTNYATPKKRRGRPRRS